MKKKSMLAHACEYIQHKIALGHPFQSSGTVIRSFGKYADKNAAGKPLTVDLVLSWVFSSAVSKPTQALKLSAVRGFAKYMLIRDSRTQLIPKGIIGYCRYRPEAYIFSKEETVKLMSTASCPQKRVLTNRTMSTIIGLLACTGMRVGEVLRLQQNDIDWRQKIIVVRASKKKSMRLIPLDSSVIKQLKKYEQCRNMFYPDYDAYFFITSQGCPLARDTFGRYWRNLFDETKIMNNNNGRPRAYDFRHTFACNHLLQAYQNNENINVAVDLLSVYLGHANPEETYWYLTGIPELMRLCSNRLDYHLSKFNFHNQK